MSLLQGIVPPILTPMNTDGRVDYDSLDRLLDHLLDAGVDGIFAMGSSGQVAYLTDAERDEVIGRVLARVAGRVPVVAGVADFTARRVIEQARRAADAGVTAVAAPAMPIASHITSWPESRSIGWPAARLATASRRKPTSSPDESLTAAMVPSVASCMTRSLPSLVFTRTGTS